MASRSGIGPINKVYSIDYLGATAAATLAFQPDFDLVDLSGLHRSGQTTAEYLTVMKFGNGFCQAHLEERYTFETFLGPFSVRELTDVYAETESRNPCGDIPVTLRNTRLK